MRSRADWGARWRRLRRAVGVGFASLVPLAGVPGTDRPTLGRLIDDEPQTRAANVGYPVAEPLTPAEARIWSALCRQLSP